jgi:hypothetical protein
MLQLIVVHIGWQDFHHEDGHRFVWTERTGYLSPYGRETLQISSDRERVRLRQPRIGRPWHDWGKHSTVGPYAGGKGGCDLVFSPRPKTRLLIWSEIATDKGAKARNGKADVGAAQEPGHVRLSEKMTGGVAIGAATQCDKIFSTGELSVLGPSDIDSKAPDRQGTDDKKTDSPRSVAFSSVTRHFLTSMISSNTASSLAS